MRFLGIDFFPQRLVAQDARDQGGMHRVSGAVGHHLTQHLLPQQRQVADQVEHLVPNELIMKAQRVRLLTYFHSLLDNDSQRGLMAQAA